MSVVIRADAGLRIGTGHVMRCLTLANELRAAGIDTTFVTRTHIGHITHKIRECGHRVIVLPGNTEQHFGDHPAPPAHAGWLEADWRIDAASTRAVVDEIGARWLVLDHYALDAQWEADALPDGVGLLVLDDLADRPHLADVLLDQNAGRQAIHYEGLTPLSCDLRIGPAHALLRPEFALLRPEALARRSVLTDPTTLLITLGGIDSGNATGRVLDSLALIPSVQRLEITVVMGDNAPHLDAVRAKAVSMPAATKVVVGISDMARHMMLADLCIGAVGSTAWERCALGLPTLQVVLAENQIDAARALAERGASLALPYPDAPEFSKALAAGLNQLLDSGAHHRIAQAAAALTDGSGATRLVHTLLERNSYAH